LSDTKQGRPWLKLLVVAVVIVGLVLLGKQFGARIDEFKGFVAGLGPLGPAVFVGAYVLATVLFGPGSLLTIASGAVFGLTFGFVWAFTGAVIGSSLAFLIARYVARSSVERWTSGNAKFNAVDQAIAREGRKIAFLLRLSPVFPFNFLNYALGLTRVSFRDYLLASLGMIPGTLLFVYLGTVAGTVAGGGQGQSSGKYVLLGVGLLATVLVTVVITRIARKALSAATGEQTA
jgi:uncharacterized membrane protein YdjX (TVP38/TMEM64 family)